MTNTGRTDPLPGIEGAVGNKERGALIHKELMQVLRSHGIKGFTLEEVKLSSDDPGSIERPDRKLVKLCCDFRRWPPCWFCLEEDRHVDPMGS
jgi:hypothetical protein